MIPRVGFAFCLCCCAIARGSGAELQIGVILGADNNTADTSDQEQWCVLEARSDIQALLTSAHSPYSLDLQLVYAGEDSESASSVQQVTDFLRKCGETGIGFVVAAYLADTTLLKVMSLARSLGIVLLCPAGGLPDLPSPRDNVLRFWPNDRYQALVLLDHIQSMLAEPANASPVSVAVMSRSDITGVGLTERAMEAANKQGSGIELLTPDALYYNHSRPDDYKGPLQTLKAAIAAAAPTPVALLCNCGNEEVGDILGAMAGMAWPTDNTFFVLTDRATPTRTVADPAHLAFAAAVRTSGVLSHIPTAGSPIFDALHKRWSDAGHTSSLFASAVASYDVVRMAARASMVLGGNGESNGSAGALADAREKKTKTKTKTPLRKRKQNTKTTAHPSIEEQVRTS